MNGKTEKEIKEFIGSIYQDEDITYKGITDTHISFEVSQMYEYVKTDFETLSTMADFFNTKKINLDNWSMAGCETCDYGSKYVVEFDIYKD